MPSGFFARNRWFLLGLAFLCVNTYAVFRHAAAGRAARGVRVELVAPADGRVAGRDTLRWRFSADMVPPGATGVWSSAGPVAFAPAVPGTFCWTLPRELTFRPDGDWQPCTDFRAVLADDLRGAGLRPLADRRTFLFHTDALALLGVSQADYSDADGLRLLLAFNAEVAPDQVAAFLTVTNAAGKTLTYSMAQERRGRTVAVRVPGEPPPELTVCLREGLTGTSGARGLERPAARRVHPARDLRVVNAEAETRPFGPRSILVTFNRALRQEALRPFVAIAPALDMAVEPGNRYFWQTESGIRISGAFQPGASYAVTLRQGLPGSADARLAGDVVRTVQFPDAAPGIEITAGGNYLSPHGSLLLPFRTIALTRCRVSVRRVYSNNLVYLANRQEGREEDAWRHDSPGDGLSAEIASRDIRIDRGPNVVVEHRLALRELMGDACGAFDVTIEGTNGKDWRTARHHVVVSDMGLSIRRGTGEFLVWANSIRTLAPVTGAVVTVFSAENQALFTGATDADGLVRFAASAATNVPRVVVARRGDDLNVLPLGRSELDVKGGIGDRPYLTAGYEACLFTDRGIYRPGETTHLKAIVRGRDAACPAPFPVRLNVIRPDDRCERSLPAMLSEFGTAEFEIPWPAFAGTGRYRLELTLPADREPLGRATVAVEEFVPPQIRVDVKTAPARARAGEDLPVALHADYLFGRPAAGLAAEARVEFVPQPFAPPAFAAFAFGDARRTLRHVPPFSGRAVLDAGGDARFTVTAVPPTCRPAAALKAVAMGTVLEIGGRGVTAYAGRLIDVYPFYVGLRAAEGAIQAGQPHAFEAVVVTPDGALTAAVARLTLTVEKLTWTSVLRKGAGDTYAYVSEQVATPVRGGEVACDGGRARLDVTPPGDGDYRLALQDPASGASSAIEFYAGAPGQHWGARSMEAPDVVELTLDRPRYVAGDTARLVIKAPFTGRALLSIVSATVGEHRVLTLTNNTAELDLPVKAAYAPNVYCDVTLLRAARAEPVWGQHRAAGRVPLVVDVPARRLNVRLAAPAAMRPRMAIDVDVAVTDGAARGAPCEVVLAAVDEGICALTEFKTPDPCGFFLAPRLPDGTLHDLYALLMPELEASVDGAASSPGGDGMGALSRRLNPVRARRFKPVALWASTVRTDAEGRARIRLDVPEFTGELRLMAVAVDRQRFGAAEARVSVRRPLVVQSSLPRFLAPADTFRLPVQVLNETGRAGEAVVRVTCLGPLGCGAAGAAAERRVAVAAGGAAGVALDLAALAAPGVATCRLDVALGDERFAEDVELAVRPPAGEAVLTGAGRVAAGASETVALTAPWLEGTGRADVWLAALPSVALGGSLDYLLQYPYGCLEQTTSKSFPLLYLADLVEQTQPGRLDRQAVDELVRAGIQRVLGMQRDDGSFSPWCGGATYVWGTLYATHFLAEAGQAGQALPEERVRAACDYIERWLAGRSTPADEDGAGDDAYNRSYACYVLALAGRPPHGWMMRLREQAEQLDRDARVNLAAAYFAAGKRREGRALLEAIDIDASEEATRSTGGSLRSVARADALMLNAWLDADPEHAAVPALVRRLEAQRENGRWYTTQENAMALLALGKYGRRLAATRRPIAGEFARPGAAPVAFADRDAIHVAWTNPAAGPLALRNGGAGALYYYWKSAGVPRDGRVKEEDRGIKVRRALLDIDGRPLAGDRLRQGDLAVVELTLDTEGAQVENIVVEDLLPAGLEIENADLKTSQAVAWCKERQTLPVLHADARDDRMLAFTGAFEGRRAWHYAVRAVTPGEFVVPPVMATCMYDAGIRSVSGAGRLRVEQGKVDGP